MSPDDLDRLEEWLDAKISLALAEARPGYDRVAGMDRLRDEVLYLRNALVDDTP